MVVYQALYGDFKVWVRPLSMFMEEVDREKYPDADQDYRFERVTEPGCRMGDGPGIQAGEEPEEEKPMNPHLLEFFDAMDVRDYDKMLEALARLSQKAGQKEVDDICMVLDIRPPGGFGGRADLRDPPACADAEKNLMGSGCVDRERRERF